MTALRTLSLCLVELLPSRAKIVGRKRCRNPLPFLRVKHDRVQVLRSQIARVVAVKRCRIFLSHLGPLPLQWLLYQARIRSPSIPEFQSQSAELVPEEERAIKDAISRFFCRFGNHGVGDLALQMHDLNLGQAWIPLEQGNDPVGLVRHSSWEVYKRTRRQNKIDIHAAAAVHQHVSHFD